jgi:hypothetical protein
LGLGPEWSHPDSSCISGRVDFRQRPHEPQIFKLCLDEGVLQPELHLLIILGANEAAVLFKQSATLLDKGLIELDVLLIHSFQSGVAIEAFFAQFGHHFLINVCESILQSFLLLKGHSDSGLFVEIRYAGLVRAGEGVEVVDEEGEEGSVDLIIDFCVFGELRGGSAVDHQILSWSPVHCLDYNHKGVSGFRI